MTEKKPKSERSRDERASQLKESLYLTFAALAVSLALTGHKEVTAAEASLTLGVTLLGTVLAVFTADVIAHLVSHERLMSIVEFRHAVRSSFGALPAVLLPFVFLAVSAWSGWATQSALIASAIALTVALVLTAYLAVRRVPLRGWQRLVILAIEAGLGLGVIALQLMAHS